jgi:hypothetical protein
MSGELPYGWTTAKVGELVQPVTDRVETEADREYKMVGVKWYGQGVFHRETVRGDKMSAKYVAPLKPGALIYNRLFAWKASFAVVPADLADCYVSNEFPQFIPNRSKLLPEYLYLWTVSERTIRAVNAASTGSAAVSRNRFREEFFLAFNIPLPPLAVQRAIVSVWEHTQAEIADTRRQSAEMKDKIEADFLTDLGLTPLKHAVPPKVFAVWWKDLERWGVQSNQLSATSIDIRRGKYRVVTGLECLAEIKHGCSASPSSKPTTLSVLRINAVTQGYLAAHERKFIYNCERYRDEFELKGNDVLLCRTNGTLGLVGMSALVEQDMPDLIFPDKIIRVRCKKNILPAYLWKVLQMPFVRSQIESAARTAVGNYAIGSEDLWHLELSLPPLDVQKYLVEKVAAQRAVIMKLNISAEAKTIQVKTDVEAMIMGNKPVPRI